MNLRQVSLIDGGFTRQAVIDAVDEGFPRQQGIVDVDASPDRNGRVYHYASNLWFDLIHIETVLKAIYDGTMNIGKAVVDRVNLQDALELLRDIRIFGIHNVIGVERLVFICIVRERETTFRHFLWNVWYTYTTRVNLWTGTGQVSGNQAITRDEMDVDDLDGEAIVARGRMWQGRWIDTRTGLPFIMPLGVVFSPFEQIVVDLTEDSDEEEEDTSEYFSNLADGGSTIDSDDVEDMGPVVLDRVSPVSVLEFDHGTETIDMRRIEQGSVTRSYNSEVLSLEEPLTQE